MALVRYRSLLVHVLLLGADNLYSDGHVDRLKALPFSNLRGSVFRLWFSGMLLHLLLRVYRAYEILLEDLD